MNNGAPIFVRNTFFIFLALTATASAAPNNNPIPVTIFGMGNSSCAHWLSNKTLERDGQSWLLGYWSAINIENTVRHTVGTNTDGDVILAEVKKICANEPSEILTSAVGRVYFLFQQSGK